MSDREELLQTVYEAAKELVYSDGTEDCLAAESMWDWLTQAVFAVERHDAGQGEEPTA